MSQTPFITVKDAQFYRGELPYYFIGTNFWYGPQLGADTVSGGRERLIRELDRMQALGIDNLRIMGLSEGPDTEPWRVSPALQTAPGVYNEAVLDGLDFLIAEMEKRGMYAVLCLNNFWPWSGGMAQYINWFEGKAIPYPPPAEGGDWARYQLFTAKFYQNEAAVSAFENSIRMLATHVNPYTGRAYREEPAIMSWQLANEPRGFLHRPAFLKWITRISSLLRQEAPQHLISLGSEGDTYTTFSGTNFVKDHADANIDYTTIHIWIQNWNWYDPQKPRTYGKALRKAKKYMAKHNKQAEKMGKPMVLEEFGISRDKDNHDPKAKVEMRNTYYQAIFEEVLKYAKKGKALKGCNFWAWGGEGRPRKPKSVWKAGDELIGDPPHEYQGWYSVYDQDQSTLDLIRSFNQKLKALRK